MMDDTENVWYNRMMITLIITTWIIPYFLINDVFLNLTHRIFGMLFIIISFSFVILCIVMMIKEFNKIRPSKWSNIDDSLFKNKYSKILVHNFIIVLAIISMILIYILFNAAETQEQYYTAKVFSMIIIGISAMIGLAMYGFTFKLMPKYFNSDMKFFDVELSKANKILKKNLQNAGFDFETKYYPKQTLMLESHQIKLKKHHVNLSLQAIGDGTKIAVNYRASEKAIKNQLKV